LAAASTVVLAGSAATSPALATETSCCSIAPSIAPCSAAAWSNSSTQHTPRSASTSAPASRQNSPPSRATDAVSPAEEADDPHT
jgi:hypothetical protein